MNASVVGQFRKGVVAKALRGAHNRGRQGEKSGPALSKRFGRFSGVQPLPTRTSMSFGMALRVISTSSGFASAPVLIPVTMTPSAPKKCAAWATSPTVRSVAAEVGNKRSVCRRRSKEDVHEEGEGGRTAGDGMGRVFLLDVRENANVLRPNLLSVAQQFGGIRLRKDALVCHVGKHCTNMNTKGRVRRSAHFTLVSSMKAEGHPTSSFLFPHTTKPSIG